MTVVRSLVLFLLAALAEIGGAWLILQGVREHRGTWWIGAGIIAPAAHGFVATLQPHAPLRRIPAAYGGGFLARAASGFVPPPHPDAASGRILAACGGVFVAGSLGWGMIVDGFRPDGGALAGALICLLGVAVIMYAPRG